MSNIKINITIETEKRVSGNYEMNIETKEETLFDMPLDVLPPFFFIRHIG